MKHLRGKRKTKRYDRLYSKYKIRLAMLDSILTRKSFYLC